MTNGLLVLKKLLLSLATSLVVLALLEAGARALLGERFVSGSFYGYPQEAVGAYDPDLGWVNRPGACTRVVSAEFSYGARINSKGLRDREHPYEPTPGVQRVALLGDSVAWGWGVDDGHSIGDDLEEALLPGAEVVNLAVPGYSTDQELWMLEREGRRYHPALVLLCFIRNDVPGNRSVETGGLEKPRYVRDARGEWVLEGRPVEDRSTSGLGRPTVSLLERLHEHSALLQLFRPVQAEQIPPSAELAEDLSATELAFRRELYEKHQKRNDRLCDELADRNSVTVMLLRRLKAACDEIGAPLVVMPVPHHYDEYLINPAVPLPPELEQPSAGGDEDFRTRLTRELASLGEEIGFPVISVDQTLLEAARRRELLQVPDGHLNERGNALVAEAAARALKPMLEGLRR